jgi:hypothetical protein
MRLSSFLRRCLFALACCAAASSARAVVISAGDGSGNTDSPGGNLPWANVGRVSGASGVYLGNRWVITANHVGTAALRTNDGRQFAVSVGSDVQLRNTNGIGRPDLKMFRLALDPGLPSLEIAPFVPGIGSQVMMIGAGLDRGGRLLGWDAAWNPAFSPFPRNSGFALLDDSHMRWGTNHVGSPTLFGLSNTTFTFNTNFDLRGSPFEAQAVLGDSGGGVFHNSGGAWQLTGLMLTAQNLFNQPADTVVFGQSTGIAALPAYGAEIMALINRAEPLWQNQANHYDVNGSGRVEPRDVLIIVNELLGEGPRDLTGARGAGERFLDVNGDYKLSTLDAQQIVNALLGQIANPASSPAVGSSFVPEPASAALFTLGVASLAIFAAHSRWKRGRKQR